MSSQIKSVIPLPGKNIKGVYRGYMPTGLPQHRPSNRSKPWLKIYGKPRVTVYPKKETNIGYSEVAEYPPLNDACPKGLKSQVRFDWYDKLRKIPTVDGKMYEILQHRDHYMASIHNWLGHYNALPMAQYLTNTRLIRNLPFSSNETDYRSGIVDDIRDIVLDQIALEKYQSSKSKPRFLTKTYSQQLRVSRDGHQLVQNIYKSVKKMLAVETNPQLLDYQHDLDPALRSWWYHSGFEPPNNRIFYKSRKDQRGRINQMIQMNGAAALNLRSNAFIEPYLSLDDPLVTEKGAVQDYCHPLREFGAQFNFKQPVALTGQWFTEDNGFDFPHTTLLSAECVELRHHKPYKVVKPLEDTENSLESQAIITAFGWTNSLSFYHGFTPFDELEYPFTNQVITTNGKEWLFNVYQLNSHTFHRDLNGPKRNNICWSSGLMELYKEFDGGKFIGVNEEVIKLLVKFLSTQTSPEYTASLNLRPYLGEEDRSEEDIVKQADVTRKAIEQRKNEFLLHDWQVPLWENIFFRWKPARNSIREMKPRYHIPKIKYPKIFE